MWRFAAHGLVPDLVTLGKPMGAGYPIGAVITRREIADGLARDYEYFSTFAATPAAAAAALAVLDTLEAGDLPEQAAVVGDYLRERLRDLAARTPRLGEVRGTGLIAGIDTYDESGAPDRAASRALLDGLVARGVLAGLTGPGGTVLKIRPPLVWETQHVDVLLDALAPARPGRLAQRTVCAARNAVTAVVATKPATASPAIIEGAERLASTRTPPWGSSPPGPGTGLRPIRATTRRAQWYSSARIARPAAITTRPGPGSTSMAMPASTTSGPATVTTTFTSIARPTPRSDQESSRLRRACARGARATSDKEGSAGREEGLPSVAGRSERSLNVVRRSRPARDG